MATRQYIGARYVPHFFENTSGTSDWRANTQYEPLTIVTRNGNSYTSKIPVPANIGAPENNPNYWVSTGIYNAQVQELSDQIAAVDAGYKAADSAIDAAYKAADQAIDTAYKAADRAIDTAYKAADAALDAAKESKRRFILIGDSYAQGESGGGVMVNGWVVTFANALRLSESKNNLWMSFAGGCGFTPTNNTFLDLLTALANTMSSAVKDSITDIVVAGGYNDRNTAAATVRTAISSFNTYARQTFSNARIWIAFVGVTRNDSDQRNLIKRTKDAYINANANYLRIEGVDLICNSEPANYGSDNIHFNATGYGKMGYYLANGVMGFNPATLYRLSGTVNLTGANNWTVPASLDYYLQDGMIHLWIHTSFNFSIGTKPAAGQPIKIADVSAPFFGRDQFIGSFHVPGYLNSGATNFKEVDFTLWFTNSELWLRIGSINNAGDGFVDLNDYLSGRLYYGDYMIPADAIL